MGPILPLMLLAVVDRRDVRTGFIQLQADAVGYAEDKQLALEATAKFVWRNFTSRLLRREFSKLTQLGAGVLSVPSLKKVCPLSEFSNSDIRWLFTAHSPGGTRIRACTRTIKQEDYFTKYAPE